jgi:methylenetetrahydrofolate reductase (NADPH)
MTLGSPSTGSGDPTIRERLAAGERSISFEFFPPKDEAGERQLWTTLRELEALQPTFVSVTYGAGGSTRDRTVQITQGIAEQTTLTPMGHLTCVGHSRDELRSVIGSYAAAGVRNVLALRGDPPEGPTAPFRPHPHGLHNAVELVEMVKTLGDFSVGVAAFPDVHPAAESAQSDARYLAAKAAAGADFAITQLFFRVDEYFALVDRVAAEGAEIPIIPGIMPITNLSQIKTITGMCGATIPDALLEQLELRADDADAVQELGVSYATLQCAELLARGAPGIHFYTLNRSPATRAILSALRLLRPWVRREVVRVGD